MHTFSSGAAAAAEPWTAQAPTKLAEPALSSTAPEQAQLHSGWKPVGFDTVQDACYRYAGNTREAWTGSMVHSTDSTTPGPGTNVTKLWSAGTGTTLGAGWAAKRGAVNPHTLQIA